VTRGSSAELRTFRFFGLVVVVDARPLRFAAERRPLLRATKNVTTAIRSSRNSGRHGVAVSVRGDLVLAKESEKAVLDGAREANVGGVVVGQHGVQNEAKEEDSDRGAEDSDKSRDH
jgi:hypothetical protein